MFRQDDMAFLSRTRRKLTEKDLSLMNIPRRYWPENSDGLGISLYNIEDSRHTKKCKTLI